jgi:hypothetical protein
VQVKTNLQSIRMELMRQHILEKLIN